MEVWSSGCAALLLVTMCWRLSRSNGPRELLRDLLRDLLGALHLLLLWAFVWAGATVFTTCTTFLAQDLRPVAFLLLSCCLMFRREKKLLAAAGRTVLITGCDSGFGHALALTLSQSGVTVFAGVLDGDGDGARRLRELDCVKLQVVQLDVTDDQQVAAAHSYISTQVADTGLWGLVNNAGVLLCPVDAELQPLSDYRRCLDVNYMSAVKMCQRFLPLLRRSRGRIVNVSSMAGNVPMPMFAAYGASKGALNIFSQVLRQEMSAWGVQVSVVQPSAFRTGIFGDSDSASRHARHLLTAASSETREDYGSEYISSLPLTLGRMSGLSAVDLTPVVNDMVDALLSARPRPLYMPGHMGWLLPFLHRCCPASWFDAIIRRLPRLNYRKPAAFTRSSL
ncbi:unnamed protein product [Ophioblennius macclurei]